MKNNKCAKKECNDIGQKIYSRRYFCIKHYRIYKMLNAAQQRGKPVPSFNQVEKIWDSLVKKDFRCPTCNKKMIKTTTHKGPRKDVVSLQHWASGKITLICHSCNVSHGGSKLEDKWFKIKNGYKYCPNCKQTKTICQFSKDASKLSGHECYCKTCKGAKSLNRYYKKKNEA